MFGNGPWEVKKIYVFDLDGTLCDYLHRVELLPDYDAFFKACTDDDPIKETIALAKTLSETSTIWIVTGRNESVKKETEQWLRKHDVPVKWLKYMRASTDRRPDTVIKYEWFRSLSKRERDAIQIVFEDRVKAVDMWREQGVRCFHVDYGVF